ncbi:MAG: PBP1A family penicillin-binding protein [Deltaproteobacteria bacterium]|nr:PBP1A family penicillin-binding protein [Deltaproteobacteria bacterium]
MAFIRSGGFRVLLALVLLLAFGTGAGAAFVYATFLRDLPDLRSVEDYQPALTSRVLDYNGKLIGSYATERRELVPLGSLPDHVGLAFVAAEDSHFFEHSGIDYMSILRAAWVDIRAGGIKQGASTITMQLVKQMLLSPERLFSRKLREMVLARKIESHFTKDEILYLYLNQIYFGAGAWGIGEAAQTYFAKPASELTVSESALLAGLPQRPSAYSPFVNPDLAERRRLYVLGRMRDDEIISEELYAQELASPPVLAARESNQNVAAAKHFTEEVRRYLFERLGGDQVLEGGLVIETTLDIELQKVAVEAVRRGLEDHDRRRGYRGPVRQVPPADLASEIEKLGEANKLLPELEETEPENESDSEAETEDETVQLAKTGSEPELELSAPEMLQPRIPRALEIGEIVEGVVVKVDPDLDTALIAFAPGVEGQVALDDVAWARKADVKSRPRPVTRIKSIFSVGDVANFVRLEGDPLVAPEEPEEKEKEKEKVAAESDEPGLEEPEEIEFPALARVTIHQEPTVEGALLSLEVETGDVRAMVGGYDYDRSQFNRATQALRQPGSAFKPFIYGAALSRDYTPVSTLYDRPAVYEDPVSGFVWRPQNYGRHFYGPMPMRSALVRSVNNATVHLFRDVGVDYVIDYSRRLGIQSPLSRDLSLALGSSSVGLVELTSAYAVFPNRGRRVIPRFITKVTDRKGNILLEDVPLGPVPPPLLRPLEFADGGEQESSDETAESDGELQLGIGDGYPDAEIIPTNQVISEAAAYLMCDLLQAVVKDPRGTGWRLRKLGRPLGGKTGTTNDQKDAWFMGFSPDIVTGVWVGNDDSTVLGWGETGSRAAAPIWVDYMEAALKQRPVLNFQEPEHIVTVRVDRNNGLIADLATADAYFQPFLEGTEPTETSMTRKSAGDTERAIREDFF